MTSPFNFALTPSMPVTPEGMFPAAQAGAARPGFLQRFQDMRRNNPEALIALGAGMMQGDMAGGFMAAGQQMANYRKRMAEEQQKNMTAEFLSRRYGMSPEDARVAAQNPALLTHLLKPQGTPTDDIREYEFAKQQGYEGTFQDWMLDGKKAGATNITVGGGKYGTIPQGYELVETPEGARMRAIPGGPEDRSQMEAAKAGQARTASDTVTTAHRRALDAARKRNFGPYGQDLVEKLPWTDSAEVARQVDTLASLASIENLTAMRQASPTGGALGNVTERELEVLKQKTGALDPASPHFERDLNDYVRTLLRVIHGPEAGDRIYAETVGPRRTDSPPAAPGARRRFNPATGRIE